MHNHELYMQRCLELAQIAAGNVSPNPLVGCVIVHEDSIVAEGYHTRFGAAHAEVEAIRRMPESILPSECTLYVNLEPCSHHGKTPPCANLIIEKGFKRVVAGMLDPNPAVSGRGFDALRKAGIEVISPVLATNCQFVNRRFITFQEKKRPHIILKWAESANGFLSPACIPGMEEVYEDERHITGLMIQKLVHKWRTQEDCILVGTQTALLDNPKLNTRAWPGREPVRAVIDRHLRLPESLHLFDNSQKTLVFNCLKNEVHNQTHWIQLSNNERFFDELMQQLFLQGIQSVVVEGGTVILEKLIGQSLWDEAIVFRSNKVIHPGTPAPLIYGNCIQQSEVDTSTLSFYQRS